MREGTPKFKIGDIVIREGWGEHLRQIQEVDVGNNLYTAPLINIDDRSQWSFTFLDRRYTKIGGEQLILQ